MAKKSVSAATTSIPEIVKLLIDVGNADTVYADVYLRRARELIGSVLTPAQYNILKGIQQEIDTAVKQSKAATMSQDWRRVETLAGRVDELRRTAQEKAALAALGAQLYESRSVYIDPFSPGFESLPGFDRDPAELRDGLVDNLKKLGTADAGLAALCESRHAFFAKLVLASKRAEGAKASEKGTAEIQQLAVQAAQRGDMSALQRYAQELLARQAEEGAAASPSQQATAVGRATYECPLDLSAPLADAVVQRAQALGFAAARTEPLPENAPLLAYVTQRIWQAGLSAGESEREGIIRAEALVDETGLPAEVSETAKVLVGQFLRNVFINSGGARYFPRFAAEVALIEDFPEEQEPPASGELLTTLGLTRRRGLARQEIDDALLQHGPTVLQERFALDPQEFRLVCIPQDLYMRFGRERGWGQQQQWTHFDGYQVLKNGALRALAGGDRRYGGLIDLISIGPADQREGVIARFAVIRRARQVARWA